MPRRGRSPSPSRAPSRAPSRSNVPAPAPPPPSQPMAYQAAPQQPGLLKQMAATAGGVAVGSAVVRYYFLLLTSGILFKLQRMLTFFLHATRVTL